MSSNKTSFSAWRESRQDSRIVRMSPTFDATSCCAAEEDERHLHEWQADIRFAPDPHSASIDGKRIGHAQRHQRDYFCSNQVRNSFQLQVPRAVK